MKTPMAGRRNSDDVGHGLGHRLAACLAVLLMAVCLGACKQTPKPDVAAPPQPAAPQDDLSLATSVVAGPEGGLAYAQAQPCPSPFGNPAYGYVADFHMNKDNLRVLVSGEQVSVWETDLLVWLDASRVLVRGYRLVDLRGVGSVDLLTHGSRPGVVSPDRRFAACRTESGDVVITDLSTLSSVTVASFGPTDWEGSGPGEPPTPRMAWSGNSVLLFDGPRDGAPAIWRYELGASAPEVLRQGAWGIQASPGGSYVSFVVMPTWEDVEGLRIMAAGEGDREIPVAAEVAGEPLAARLYWNEPEGLALILGPHRAILAAIRPEGLALLAQEDGLAGTVLPGTVKATDASFVASFGVLNWEGNVPADLGYSGLAATHLVLEAWDEVIARLDAAARIVVRIPVGVGPEVELSAADRQSLADLVRLNFDVDGPAGGFFPPWPRPTIEAFDSEGTKTLVIRCLEQQACEVDPGRWGHVWLSNQLAGVQPLWDWAASRLPPVTLDQARPESLMLATGIWFQNGLAAEKTWHWSGCVVDAGDVLSRGECAGPAARPESPELILTFEGVPEGREEVLVTAEGFWWAGQWYRLKDALEIAGLQSVP